MTAIEAATPAKKKIKKVVPKKKATPKKTAAPKQRKHGLGEKWKKVLRAIGAAEAKGMSIADMKAACKRHGVKAWFLRFIREGTLQYVDRGVYRLTADGKKRIGG